jgi:hypothetical protein
MLALHADDVTNPYSQFALNQYRVDRNEGYKMDQLSTAFGAFIGVVVILDRPAGGNVHSCPKCAKWKQNKDPTAAHVVRTCPKCGREVAIRDEGKFGIGFKVKKGDKVVLPKELLQVSANPLKGTSYLTEHGLAWFAQLVFGTDIANRVIFPRKNRQG